MSTRLQDYTVGWICALDTEYVVACELLDEEYEKDKVPRVDTLRDHNIYTFGRVHEHNVVIACLPDGRYGLTSAAVVAERMRSSFPALRFGLMVGIAGAAPSNRRDIRLGDIVVSSPTSRHGGVIQYDFGKAVQEHEFEETGCLPPPPEILLNALTKIKSQHKRKGHHISETIDEWLQKNPRLKAEYSRPDKRLDRLYRVSYIHSKQETCDCQIPVQDAERSESIMMLREERESMDNDIRIHHGLIASASRLMKDATARDALIGLYDVLCFETEAAGLMHNFPCLVIRGISDYSDTHKNDKWQGFAAATAAAYAKELLGVIPGNQIESIELNKTKKSGRTVTTSSSSQRSETDQRVIAKSKRSLQELDIPLESVPPEEDMNPENPDMEPQEQKVRFEGDLYTPRFVRGHGNQRQGYCGLCKPGKWLVLKDSAFWYDKSFRHGINAATGQPFDAPKETQRRSDNANVSEALCGNCGEWIVLNSDERKSNKWFRHAYECQSTRRKSKNSPNKRPRLRGMINNASKGWV